MKTNLSCLMASMCLITAQSFAQKTPPTRPLVPDYIAKNAELNKKLVEIVTTKQPVPDGLFKELVYVDFTKLLQAGGTSGKPLNYATVNITKPNASVNYTIGPTKNKKWFINLGASGGFDDDLITLVENQKPAKSYAANASFSYILSSVYKYSPNDNYTLKEELKTAYAPLHIYDYERPTVEYLEYELKESAKRLSKAYDILEKQLLKKGADVSAERKAITDELDTYTTFRKEKEELVKKINDRQEKLDALYTPMKFPSKHMTWITLTQKAGGNQFRFYDAVLPEKTIANGKSNRSVYQSSATFNYYYNNSKRNFRFLGTFGISAGSFNNFDELSGSEYKVVAKKEIDPNTYTKSDSYTVYDQSSYKSYHASQAFIEGYFLISKNGNFGLRTKYLFDMPYGEDKLNEKFRRSQQDAEIGVIFNTNSKPTKEKADSSPISFELYYGFNDLGGRQYEVKGKFYKRSEIGIKTAIPFSF
ncbi:hypothetical protein GM921_00540 [Pedobacter sp. LMG 31464]|uniref:Uncharacterized protein n=1 Tax=Pedobacter planticolens TaxID=2679964 RepID=A0A923DU96_9SPHI|nr:hypothetical protein [Pedobacter planticolens]MBB2143957.1 hypothetical protein [Pedobacter planticolens]